MNTQLATTNGNRADAIEAVIAKGDLAKLTPEERVNYYRSVCESVGLNPLTRPFEYITLSGRMTLYARKDATDQLRKINGVSLHDPSITYGDGLVTVAINASTADGRADFDLGAVSIEGLKGEARANAVMKAITKAKRRVTLSICGLGWMDESEIESIPDAAPRVVNPETGEIMGMPAVKRPALPAPAVIIEPADRPVWREWASPQDALAWAQRQGLALEDARALLSTAKGNNGGKLNSDTAPRIYPAFEALVNEATDTAEEKPVPQAEIPF